MIYPKKRKPSRKVTCEICGKRIFIRGYKPHLWLKHGIPQNTKVSNSSNNSSSNLGESGKNETTQVSEPIEVKSKEVIKVEKQVEEWLEELKQEDRNKKLNDAYDNLLAHIGGDNFGYVYKSWIEHCYLREYEKGVLPQKELPDVIDTGKYIFRIERHGILMNEYIVERKQ